MTSQDVSSMTGSRCPESAGSGANFKEQQYILQLWNTGSLLMFVEENEAGRLAQPMFPV